MLLETLQQRVLTKSANIVKRLTSVNKFYVLISQAKIVLVLAAFKANINACK